MESKATSTISVQFTLDANEQRVLAAERERFVLFPRLQRAITIICIAVPLLVVGAIAYSLLAEHTFPTWPQRRIEWVNFGLVIANVIAIVSQRLVMTRNMLPRVKPTEALDLCIDHAGISFAGSRSCKVPWRSITGVHDTDAAFVVTDVSRNALVIPKRALDDNGVALWAFLEARLIGRRNLIRRPDARRFIFNTTDNYVV